MKLLIQVSIPILSTPLELFRTYFSLLPFVSIRLLRFPILSLITDKTFFPMEETEWLEAQPPHLTSPYGLLRSPWNYNPAPYLTRYNNVNQITNLAVLSEAAKNFFLGSNCDDYENFMRTYAQGQTLETYLSESENNVHGKVHFAIGGAGGDNARMIDDKLRKKYGFTDDQILILARSAQELFKR